MVERGVSGCLIEGARTHNLKSVTCRIPFGKLTAVTGVSGSGKSSLAFDVLYAEGQRRFVDCLSTYARQFLQRLDRPEVDRIGEIQPPIALKQQVSIRNARSTVGSITELSDLLHLLFAHGGTPFCPADGSELVLQTAESAAGELRQLEADVRYVLVAEVEFSARGSEPKPKKPGPQSATTRSRKKAGAQSATTRAQKKAGPVNRATKRAGTPADPTAESPGGLAAAIALGYQEQGYSRVYEGGEVREWSPPYSSGRHRIVIDRFVPGKLRRGRALESMEAAWRLGAGRALVIPLGQTDPSHVLVEGLSCRQCGQRSRPLRPQLLSPNSPLGACPTCNGFGRITTIDREKVVPDGTQTLRGGAVAPFETKTGSGYRRRMLAHAAEDGIDLDRPYADLSAREQEWVFSGGSGFGGVQALFAKLERKRYRAYVRIMLARYRGYETCPDCLGSRLHPQALSVLVGGKNLAELEGLPLHELDAFLKEEIFSPPRLARIRSVLGEIRERLRFLREVGLEYLTLSRTARTLSGGETQRIRLASGLGTSLTQTLYVLDEPTVGLHAADTERMLGILHSLCRAGNTAVVVEHDPEIALGSDHLIVLGPSGGENGGEILFEGPPAAFLREQPSFFSVARSDDAAATSRRLSPPAGWIRMRGVAENNLRLDEVALPTDRLVVVTGVSGSGKSTLVDQVLHRNALRFYGKPVEELGSCGSLEGLDAFENVLLVSQNPLGRSTRSTLVSYCGLLATIRKRLAASPRSGELGLRPGDFSFNVEGGRCEACRGMGTVLLEMHFMADVEVTCEVCRGKRFHDDVLSVTLGGRSILQILDLTVSEALEAFAGEKEAAKRLQPLVKVGLEYLRLGQSTSTLSGGEAQRLRLGSLLSEGVSSGRQVFIFDEPTSGLHPRDIQKLLAALRELVELGHAVVVVEHQLDFIRACDWVIDLGPGGGDAGGRLVYAGPVSGLGECPESVTGASVFGGKPVKRRSRPRVSNRPRLGRAAG